ncbi:hypothetical protein QCE63_32480 [Caballeronia sp. LZ065]|uniref:hypothetical protein n=1 Tax=Caballeronia sp. LZ065 TaxID=3038571 RepID=UPI00285BF652|nr:hypothetical protein [Caballeronia sp. LZ065]MDR5784140.1 hypothetical protein [Caballeronia sp. LZ065]
MLRAQVDQETNPNDASSLRSRRSRHRIVSGHDARDAFGMRSDAANEAAQDSEEGSDETLASSPGGFIDVLMPLAGQMAFEIVTALFANYRDMEAAYADLKQIHARIRTSDKREWTGILTDLIAFMRKCAPLLPHAAQRKVSATCDALEQVDQLWNLCDSIRQAMNNPELAWHDKPGLIASALQKCKSAVAYLPDSFRDWIAYASEAQKQFTASYQAIEHFESQLSSVESGDLAMIAAIQSTLDNEAFKLPQALRNFLNTLPRSHVELQAYRGKVSSLLLRFKELSEVRSIADGLSSMQELVSAGLIDMRGLSTHLDSALDIESQVGQWYSELTELRTMLGATLEAKNASDALTQVSKALDLRALKLLLGEPLVASLGAATEMLAGLSKSFDAGQGIHARLTSIVQGDESLRQKLNLISRLISETEQLPESFRSSLVDVPVTLNTLSDALAFGSMDTNAGMLEQIAKALRALQRLTMKPFVRQSLGADASGHSARVIGTMAQALDIVGLLEKQIHREATFEAFVHGLMSMRGEGTALSEALEQLSGLADSILQSLEPERKNLPDSADAGSTAGKLSALLGWLAHPEAEKLILSGVPIQYKETTQNAVRLFRQISGFPATGSWDNQRAWLREHLVNADTLHLLIGSYSDTVKRWRSLVVQNDAVMALLKRFLPLINGNNLTLSSIRSVLCSREAAGAAQQALSVSLIHVESPVGYGIGTVVEQGIGLSLALTDEDEAIRRCTMTAIVEALENMSRSMAVRYARAANPVMALLADALYSILLGPMLKKFPEAYARNVTAADRESCRAFATALARTLLSTHPSAAELTESVKKFAIDSPALTSWIRVGAAIVQQIGSHIWEIHLTLDVYLLVRADSFRRAERLQALTTTLATLRKLGYEWAGPLATLAPLLPDLDDARKLLKRELPQADSWFDWSVALSPMLAQSNAPSIVRLRQALAGQVAASLRGGFHQLVQFGFSEQTKPDARNDIDARLDVAQAQAKSLHAALLALAPKVGAAAEPLLRQARGSIASMPSIKRAFAWLRGAQPTEFSLVDGALAVEYEHHGIQLSEENRALTKDGSPDPCGIYHHGASRYIRVEGRTFEIVFDSSYDILRLLKPGASEHMGGLTGPAITFRDKRWFVTDAHKMLGGTLEAEALEMDVEGFEAEYLVREVQALLDVIEAGTYPFAEAETLRYQLSDFQLTFAQLEAVVKELDHPARRWTGTAIGAGLAVLCLLALIYSWYTCRSPFPRRRNASADLHDVQTNSAEEIAWVPMGADSQHVAGLPVVPEADAVPRRGASGRIPQIAGVAFLVSGGVFVLGSLARTWLRREQDAANLPKQSVAEPQAGSSTAHQVVKRAVAASNTGRDCSALAKYLDDYEGCKLDDKRVTMPDNIDDVLCVYADKKYYVPVEAKFFEISQLQRNRFGGNPFEIDPSIRYFANLALGEHTVVDVVYAESLRWRVSKKWDGGTYPGITPEAPLYYVEHSKDLQRGPRSLLDEFLYAKDKKDSYSGHGKLIRRNPGDHKRVFWTLRSGYLIKAVRLYWPLTWWKIFQPDSNVASTFTAAGYVTYGKNSNEKAMFVLDEDRGWMPAVFANGDVHIFNSLDDFHRFEARYHTRIEPLLVPSTKSLVDQVIERRFSKADAVHSTTVGAHPKKLGHQVYFRIDKAGYIQAENAYFYFKNDEYRPVDLKESDHESGAFASRDLTYHGHFDYTFEGQKRILHVVFSKTEGLLPSVMNDQGKLDGMRNPSSASNTTASAALLELGRTFGSDGAYGAQGQQRGQDGSLYYDLLDGQSDLLICFAGRYWQFQWRNVSEGVLSASFGDGTVCDVNLRLANKVWALDWEGRSAPSWFTECLRTMMARGEVGVRLIREAEKKWAKRPVRNAAETMQILSACLNSFEAEYRSTDANEKWRTVIILTAQLFAFFAHDITSGDWRQEFPRRIIEQLGRIIMQEDFSEYIDKSIMDDAVESTDSINAIEKIDAELAEVDEQKTLISRAILETTAIKNNAGKVFYVDPLYVFGGKPSVEKVPAFFKLGFDWLLQWNDLTHDWVWAEEYLIWLNKAQTEVDDKKKVLQDRRDHLGSTELYKRIFDAYQAGIEKGKKLEEKYALAIDWRAGAYEVNQRTLWAHYSGALAELALAAQRSGKAGVSRDTADAETVSARYYLWTQFSKTARFHELISAVGSEIESRKIKPKDRYTDITDCIVAAREIIYEGGSNKIEFVTTDLAFLAVSIYTISTTSQSVETMRGRHYNGLHTTFLEKGRSFHPFAVLPEKPASYLSMAGIKPSSQFGSGDERYERYDRQFTDYRATGLPYDAGLMIKIGLENVQLQYGRMYDVKAIVNLDVDWVGVTARAHLIQLNDDSCLFYFFVKNPTVKKTFEKQRKEVEEEVKSWHTGMEWLPKIPNSPDLTEAYSSALRTMRPFMVEALSELTSAQGRPGIYFGKVKCEFENHARGGGRNIKRFEKKEKISPPADSVIGTQLVPYLLRETEKDLSDMADLLHSSMHELSPKDKWIGFFVVFYSQIRKASLDKNHNVDPFAIIVDAATVLLTVVPWLRSSIKIVKDANLGGLWKLGIRTGLNGRKLAAHVIAQIPLKSVTKLGREFLTLLFDLFFPFTFPLNPFALNFRGVISKGRVIVRTRSAFEVLSDTRSLKAFLDNAILPPNIAALAKVPVKPEEGVTRVGPDLYRNEFSYDVDGQQLAIHYIKVGDIYYVIDWDTNFDTAVLDDASSPFPSYLRRRFADWVASTSPRRGGGAASPTWAGAGLDRTSAQARYMVTEVRIAKSDALVMLRQAREAAMSDAQDVQEQVKQAFQIFLNDSSPATIHGFAHNLSNIIEFLTEISVSDDVAFLGGKAGRRLSAMAGSAFDIAEARDATTGIQPQDVDAEHNQRVDAVTGPGFIKRGEDTGAHLYAAREDIIPLAMRPDNFDTATYIFDVTAHLVRTNEFCRSVIREGFVATTKNRRIARKWTALMEAAKQNLTKFSAAEKQVFYDQLSLTYNLFVFDGQPLEARPLAAFVNANARGWNATGEEVGVDISGLLREDRKLAEGESATAARMADPDLFSFLVVVLSDIRADPPRFEDFTTRAAQLKPGEKLMWKWFKGEPSA